MLLKVIPLLLQTLSAYIANVALFFILLQTVSDFSERTECINHESTNNIAEKHFEEGEVNDIIDKSHDFELLHGLADDSRDVELNDAGHDIVTHILDLVCCGVKVLHVVAECDCAEDKAEEYSHHTHQQYLVPVVDHAQQDGAQLIDLREDIN